MLRIWKLILRSKKSCNKTHSAGFLLVFLCVFANMSCVLASRNWHFSHKENFRQRSSSYLIASFWSLLSGVHRACSQYVMCKAGSSLNHADRISLNAVFGCHKKRVRQGIPVANPIFLNMRNMIELHISWHAIITTPTIHYSRIPLSRTYTFIVFWKKIFRFYLINVYVHSVKNAHYTFIRPYMANRNTRVIEFQSSSAALLLLKRLKIPAAILDLPPLPIILKWKMEYCVQHTIKNLEASAKYLVLPIIALI